MDAKVVAHTGSERCCLQRRSAQLKEVLIDAYALTTEHGGPLIRKVFFERRAGRHELVSVELPGVDIGELRAIDLAARRPWQRIQNDQSSRTLEAR